MQSLRIAILVFDAFSEIDAFTALGLQNRLGPPGWRAELASPSARPTSMNGVAVEAQQPRAFANDADAVPLPGNLYARAIAENGALLDRLALDPLRQSIGAQCSGTLLLARLGLIADVPACTDLTTKPWVIEAGVRVIDAPFHARGPIATAGGCLSAQYLAAWMMIKRAGPEAAAQALHYVAPVGEKDAYVERLLAVVKPFLAD